MKHDLFIIRHRWWFIIVPLVITALMLIPLSKARINTNLMDYLPDDIPSKVNLNKLEAQFGKYDPVLIIFESKDVLNEKTLVRISALNDSFKRSKEIKQVVSLFESKYIRNDNGSMLVDPVVKRIPKTETSRETLRNEIKDNPLAYKLLVSSDFRYTIMLLNPAAGVSDGDLSRTIKKTLDENPGEEEVYIGGLPSLRFEIQRIATRDLAILMPLGLIIMLLTLFLSFREKKSVFLPFSVVCMSIAVAMGLMPLLGFDYSLIAVLVPIMMIAIANNYGVHLMTRYQELNAIHPRWGMKRIVNESVKKLYMPIILTALTTIVGVLGLVSHLLIPAKQIGIVSAAGILFALLASLLFIPAVMSSIKKGNLSKNFEKAPNGIMGHFLDWTGRMATGKPWSVITVFVVLLIISGAGISRLQVNINLDEMMPKSHPLRSSVKILDDEFGGTKTLSVLFEGDVKSPEVMQAMENFGSEVKKIPEVSSVTSLATVIRTISRAINNPGNPYYDRIPDKRDAIAQYIEFYNMSGDPADFEQMVDFDYTKSVATIQFKAKNYSSFKNTESKIREIVKQTPFCTLVAGQSLVEKELAEAVIKGQIWSLLFAMGSIILLLWIIFRSLRAGLMGSLPLIVSLIFNFGLMGWIGLQLDIATSMLSSIAIGIGVDYTIHLFWRMNHELQHGKPWDEAIIYTLRSTGRGIAINAFSVTVGFAVLFFSGLTILKSFGFLIIFSLLICLLCALLLIPALLQLSHPRFLLKHNKSQI